MSCCEIQRQSLLAAKLVGNARGDKNRPNSLRVDKNVPYGDLMEVMNLLRAAGHLKLTLAALEKVSGP